MSTVSLVRLSGLALMAGGVCIATFVVVLYPVSGFFGAEHVQHPAWVPAHSLHFIGALLSLFGLIGLYLRHREHLGTLGFAGFVLAFAGTAQFVGTGMLTAFVWPVLAAAAPATMAANGAAFAAPASLLFYFTALSLIPGYLVLSIALCRTAVLPRGASVLLAVGVVLAITPPEPVGPIPWLALVLGGILFGAGEIWLGFALVSDAGQARTSMVAVTPFPAEVQR
ncbi:MAG: hypothetical protein ACR2IK_11755 [Chloroflexota bacterium]